MRIFNMEYERKFLLNELPIDFDSYTKQEVKQCYLLSNSFFSIRTRDYGNNRCYLDIKIGSGLSKIKIGFRIKTYKCVSKSISKVRYKKRMGGLLFVIDIFDNGLRLVEIEAKNKNIVNRFRPPSWFGREVTSLDKYKNRYLAK